MLVIVTFAGCATIGRMMVKFSQQYKEPATGEPYALVRFFGDGMLHITKNRTCADYYAPDSGMAFAGPYALPLANSSNNAQQIQHWARTCFQPRRLSQHQWLGCGFNSRSSADLPTRTRNHFSPGNIPLQTLHPNAHNIEALFYINPFNSIGR